jgi:hypothetical protein
MRAGKPRFSHLLHLCVFGFYFLMTVLVLANVWDRCGLHVGSAHRVSIKYLIATATAIGYWGLLWEIIKFTRSPIICFFFWFTPTALASLWSKDRPGHSEIPAVLIAVLVLAAIIMGYKLVAVLRGPSLGNPPSPPFPPSKPFPSGVPIGPQKPAPLAAYAQPPHES